MVGATASALVGLMNPLLGKLSSLVEREYGKLKGVWREIDSLREELCSMKAALEVVSDLEEPSLQVKEWMRQVRELSYDVEDCIDDFMYHLDQDDASDSLIRKISRRLKNLRARLRIASQITELKEHLEEVSNRQKRYEHSMAPSSSSSVVVDPRLPALFEEVDRLVGIKGPMDELIKWLTEDTDSKKQRKVISIVGFGGLGKTTLANQVYQQIRSQFDCTAFVSVSRDPIINKVLVDILTGLIETSNPTTIYQEQHIKKMNEDLHLRKLGDHQLITMIKDYLKDKRYFIIVDDIWGIPAWESIQYALARNNCASKIMTTTRNNDVAKACCFPHEEYVYAIKPLSHDESKRLFFKRIFGHEEECYHELKEVAEEILKKCGGLPLAIVNIASLLAIKPLSKQEWERIRNSIGYALEQHQELEVVRRILLVSYCDLPPHLKICLLHLSVFPEDFEINRSHLIWRWIAEGSIAEQRGHNLEEVGEKYFNELVNRNMIQPIGVDYCGRARACRVHDIMLDVIISLSTEENFITVLNGQNFAPSTNKIRRLSLQGNCEEYITWLRTNSLSHVRSISVFGCIKKFPPPCELQNLRVLDVKRCYNLEGDHVHIEDFGSLKQLRYLSLGDIIKIPRQIGKLQLLQTLDLSGTKIKELPEIIVQLRQLVRLLLRRSVKLPNGIGNMVALEELSWFDGSRNSPEVVLELGNLINLEVLFVCWRAKGAISDKGRYGKSLVSSLCKLGQRNLRSLHIEDDNGSSVKFLVDSWYPPPSHLKIFQMFGLFYLPRFPKWISSISKLNCLDINMEQMVQEDLQVFKNLPALLCLKILVKEPLQETLTISCSGFQYLREFCSYPSDYELGLTYLKNKKNVLGVMFETGAMPKLERLKFGFYAHDALSAYGVGFDFGIHHLTSLKHLSVHINCRGAKAWEVEATQAAIRSAAALLPNHRTPDIRIYGEANMAKDEDQREDADGANVPEKQDGTK